MITSQKYYFEDLNPKKTTKCFNPWGLNIFHESHTTHEDFSAKFYMTCHGIYMCRIYS